MIKEFNEYVKTFDLTVKQIMGKYHHSFRVMELSELIAKSIDLSEDDILLAKNCGLLHDIARFRQWTDYNTYHDSESIDHGDLGYEILNNYFLKDCSMEDKKIILNATKYHNKLDVPKLDDRTSLFCKIVRDADKLDIMIEQYNKIDDEKIIIKKELIDNIINDQMCKNEYVKNDVDRIIRLLSWINDLNFKYSYNYLLNKHIIDKKIDLLSIYGETDEIKELKEIVYKKIEKRMKYVR